MYHSKIQKTQKNAGIIKPFFVLGSFGGKDYFAMLGPRKFQTVWGEGSSMRGLPQL